MKVKFLSFLGLSFISICVNANPGQQVEAAVKSGSNASTHTSASFAHSLVATGQLASGVVAIPLLSIGAVAGGVGASAMAVGTTSLNGAQSTSGNPLPLTEETVTVLPPNHALKQPALSKN
jgi:hypothetical protein